MLCLLFWIIIIAFRPFQKSDERFTADRIFLVKIARNPIFFRRFAPRKWAKIAYRSFRIFSRLPRASSAGFWRATTDFTTMVLVPR